MSRFDYFIVFAEMRTGSNFLEANLNAFDGVHCLGELFNPHFIGYPNKTEMLDFSQEQRDADPMKLVRAVKQHDGLAGFRCFHDHDARVIDKALADPRCAKIVLTRNPLESYVSWKIAQETGQWKLTNVTRRKDAQATFDAAEFDAHVEALQAFQLRLMRGLQVSGQTAFYLAYEDLRDLDVMNGLAAWLGIEARLEALDSSLKPQNPAPIIDKVANPDAMEKALAGVDRFNLTRTPNFEPRRGAATPSYVGAAQTPLLFLPMRGAPEDEVIDWMAALDGVDRDALAAKMSQKDLRKWKRQHQGHRSFTVIRHPVARAHAAFCRRILPAGEGSYLQIRDTLRRVFKVSIPKSGPDADWSRAAHRKAFVEFTDFLRANLAGQTAIRVDATWCSQSQALQGFGDFVPPDHVFREAEWRTEALALARSLGAGEAELPPAAAPDTPYALDEIYDDEIEEILRKIYQRDYMMFGWGSWKDE
ncbi:MULTISPECIES: sulfotransferase family 2 domain-containing protein [Alphaproteobacteria]|uniref:Nodulation protein NodH n=1 Tax=Marinibacterium profundimaris TaxID=1679460 RepID=A0A225NP79_9RHOB|nr:MULTISPECIES: sulfotransferase family 2 domain-containing protein [Alphaproteobacteria]MAC89627.1 nodulation protein NodH [Maricaulis sp.]OWU75730.1 nodulation protein NodH [Marinibacterium profundimaris]